MSRELAVSVVVPAHNSAQTIRRTLESLIAQTFRNWEAVVVDDGSTDDTVAIASEIAALEPRISVLREPHRGASHTRNAGLARARQPWLYFLDSDDWIDPRALERMTGALAADPNLDAVHCGWALVSADGNVIEESRCAATGDLFPILARRSAFTIHACVVAREFAERAGGFDPAMRVSEDWVFWQRIARLGARFGSVPETLAFYLQRPGSLSADPVPLFGQALTIIEMGHGLDPRISEGPHVLGEPIENLTGAKLNYLCWIAGMMIARRFDPVPLLSRIERAVPRLQPEDAAASIYRAVPAALATQHAVWSEEWARLEPRSAHFLDALEQHMAAAGHAKATMRALTRRVLDAKLADAPELSSVVSAGALGALRIDATAPIADVRSELERLRVYVHVQNEQLGVVELPVIDGVLRSDVLADVIADRFAWAILQKFFQKQLYAFCVFHVEGDTCSAFFREARIARDLPLDQDARLTALHDAAGWQLLLDEVWTVNRVGGRPGVAGRLRARFGRSDIVFVETSEPLPTLPKADFDVVLTVGGTPLGLLRVPQKQRGTSATELRQTLNDFGGLELCRLAVREGLVGQKWDGRSLRERLAARKAEPVPRSALRAENQQHLAPGWKQHAARHAASDPLLLFARRSGALGSSASRVFALPRDVREQLLEAERHNDTPIVRANEGETAGLLYVPALVRRSAETPLHDGADSQSATSTVRHDFESLFARGANPWHYDSAYEQRKYEQTLSLVPSRPLGRALELACAEGHFTAQLAPHVRHLLATDISEIALQRAAQRCQSLANVEFQTLDVARAALPAGLDLIVCSEMLYYVGDVEALRATARKIADALQPGGVFITAHARVAADEPDGTGYAWDVPFGAATIIDVFSDTAPLQLVRELRTPLYRIAMFEARANSTASPQVTTVDFELPRPEIAAHIVWNDAARPSARVARLPKAASAPTHLPILMYHHVAPAGPAARRRMRVHPDGLEAQLRYLRACGFASASLEDWRDIVEGRRKHPARPVLLTFDDAYVDFEEHAWPLLRSYGFDALLFVVTASVGAANTWDVGAGAEPVLDWSALRRLREQGVTIGSHTVTHARLTGLSTADIVREAIESRATLERELGVPVRSLAYPYGDEDEVVQHLTGAAGYLHGLSCRPGLATRRDSWLALPRIEVTGFDDLPSFIAKLAP